MSKPKAIPRVFVTKNLLYCVPDTNTRYAYLDGRQIASVEADKDGWSKANQRELDEIVLALQACP